MAASVRTIVLALNEGDSTEAAFRYIVEGELRDGDKLHLVHVCPGRKNVSLTTPSQVHHFKAVTLPLQQIREEQSRKLLSHYSQLAETAKISFEVHKVEGDTAEVLALTCEQLGASLVVIGDLQEGLIRRLLTWRKGNVEALLKVATCPVLVVKSSGASASRKTAALKDAFLKVPREAGIGLEELSSERAYSGETVAAAA